MHALRVHPKSSQTQHAPQRGALPASNYNIIIPAWNYTYNYTGFGIIIKGISIVSPTEKLDVNGSINISSGSEYKINGVAINTQLAG